MKTATAPYTYLKAITNGDLSLLKVADYDEPVMSAEEATIMTYILTECLKSAKNTIDDFDRDEMDGIRIDMADAIEMKNAAWAAGYKAAIKAVQNALERSVTKRMEAMAS